MNPEAARAEAEKLAAKTAAAEVEAAARRERRRAEKVWRINSISMVSLECWDLLLCHASWSNRKEAVRI